MKTAPVEDETKGGPFNVVLKKVSQPEIALNIGFGSFFFCLFQCNVRHIDTDHLKAILGKPSGIIPGATADIQGLAARNITLGDRFDKVEIRLTGIPRGIPGFVSVFLTVFDGHRIALCGSARQCLTTRVEASSSGYGCPCAEPGVVLKIYRGYLTTMELVKAFGYSGV